MNLLSVAIVVALAATDGGKTALEDVTILGTADSPIETIGAANVISPVDLQRFAYADIQQILRQVPGVTVQIEAVPGDALTFASKTIVMAAGGQIGDAGIGPGLLVVIEGADAGGKGGATRRIVERLSGCEIGPPVRRQAGRVRRTHGGICRPDQQYRE